MRGRGVKKEMYLDLISKNQRRLYGLLKSLHSYENDIEDILQETNITLLNKQEQFDDTKEFLPWAFAIARFTLLNHKKKKAKESKNIVYDTPLMDVALEFEDCAIREELFYDTEVERIKLINKIKEVLPRKQLALLNAMLEGRKIRDIAEEWGDRLQTVYILRTRTIRKIKDTILKMKFSKKYDY